jgi:hypothetical protein
MEKKIMANQNQPVSGRPRIRIPAAVSSRANNVGCLWIILAVLAVLFLLALLRPDVSDPLGIYAQNRALQTQIAQIQAGGAVQGTPTPGSGGGAGAGGQQDFTSGVIYLNGTNVGTVLNPQSQIEHPSFYIETGVTGTVTWNISVPNDGVLIVGGTSVDGVGGGVYKAMSGGQSYNVTVTNGFAAVTKREFGNGEFCFRVGQAVQYNWAHQTVQPLSGWTSCGNNAVIATSTPGAVSTNQPAGRTNLATGVGQSVSFNVGESAYGFRIRFSNGKTCDNNGAGGVFVRNATMAGSLTDGIINPSSIPANAVECRPS